ncbi:MAG TPA: ATP-dependent DNA ligase [Gemmatimonadales bacterium]|nr:ATP-dependent DNA ligase [Gemmatimonadales bacterium]
MDLKALAVTFARLEETGGRLAAIDILARLFDRAAPSELAPLVYLLQGQLRPAYEGVEVGVGDRLLVRAIARAYDASETAVTRHYKRRGDLGLVAESLAGAAPRRRLSVREAHEALLEIARTSGAGAVEGKIRLLVALLRRAAPIEGRYLVRIVQGRLRLGLGDATIIEATAAGALGDRRKKPVVEHAYNVRSDLGAVVRLAYATGGRALARVSPEIGVPVRPALAQRLGSAEAILKRLGHVDVEPKYDGFRLQLHRDGARVWAFSRRLENVSAMFPELAAGARRQLKARRAIIEGEAVVYDPRTGRFLPFQVTITRKRKYGIAEAAARHPLRLFAFDLLYANGHDCLTLPQRERHRHLAALLRSTPGDPVAVTEVFTARSATDLQDYFDKMIARGLEGIIAKRPDAPYRAGARGFDWVKLKRAYQSRLRDTVDVVLVGYLAGRGARAALGIGSLLAAVYDPGADRFRTIAKIGSGPSEEEWKSLRTLLDREATSKPPRRVESLITPDVWVEPKVVVEVLADEITRSPRHTCGRSDGKAGYALRFPRMLGVRSDKKPEDATTEREVLEIFRMQRNPGKPRLNPSART